MAREMKNIRNYNLLTTLGKMLIASFFCYSAPVFAEQWKPLCIDGSSCRMPYQVSLGGGLGGYDPIDPDAAGPLVTSQGILLHHVPLDLEPCQYCAPRRHILRLTSEGLEDLGDGFRYVSDVNAFETPSGRKMAWQVTIATAWFDPKDGVEELDYTGRISTHFFNTVFIVGPPVAIGDFLYIGLRSGGGQSIWVSIDDGDTWQSQGSNITLGIDRYNLMANPERNGLWAIQSNTHYDVGLWESSDGGRNWDRIDDGSFPADTVRVVVDPDDVLESYALTSRGLFKSSDRGISWNQTSLTEAVHGLVFVHKESVSEGEEVTFARSLVVGTDTGILVSHDEAENWESMSKGLLAQPYTVTWAHGYLLATGDSGYFTCNAVDCFGTSQAMEEDKGIIDVVEFYNSILDHYFITGDAHEADLIDNGAAGPGWSRTGESFKGWSLGSSEQQATDVCRFYGSVWPGPNSHFYTLSAPECRFLMDLQEIYPDDGPRWNFEGYVFSGLPPAVNQELPCPDSTTPVYRAYNDGFRKGIDSNHRYAVDKQLLESMANEGWIMEGVAFCSPISSE